MNYVLVYVYDPETNKVLIIHKDRPSWQNGKINFPGGKIEEEDKTPAHAASRELYEETEIFISYYDLELSGKIFGNDFSIHVFKVEHEKCDVHSTESELPEWINYFELLKRDNLIPNLYVMTSLLMSNIKNWKLYFDEDNFYDKTMKYKIEF